MSSFDERVIIASTTRVHAFRVGKLVYFANMHMTDDLKTRVSEMARLQAADVNPKGCRECIGRALNYASLVGPDGPVFLKHIGECDDIPTCGVRELCFEAEKNGSHFPVHPFVVTSRSFRPVF